MRFTKIITAFFLLAASQSFAQKPVLSLIKGQKITISSTSKVTSTAEVMGQSMENNIDASATQVADVTDVTTAGATFSMVNTRVTATVQAMGQEMSYDSDKKDNEGPMAEAMAKYVNVPVVVTMDAQGTVTKKETKIEASAAGSPSMGAFEDKLTEVGFVKKNILGRDLSAGLSWQDSATNAKGKLTTKDNGVFTVVTIENGMASFTYEGTSVSTGTLEQMGQEMEFNSQNKVSSRFVIDLKSGIVLIENTSITVSATVNAGGMEIPVTGTNTYSMNVKVN